LRQQSYCQSKIGLLMNQTTILCVDDDSNYVESLKNFLEGKGYSVRTAMGEAQAKKIIEDEGIALAIIDIRLSNDNDEEDISGLLLAKEVAPNVPKIILSSYPSYDVAREFLRPSFQGKAIAKDVISKQEGLQALLASVQALTNEASKAKDEDSSLITPLSEDKSASVSPRTLQVFLCHSKSDKPKVREIYNRLKADGIDPWLDEKNLLVGQEWELEIVKAVHNSDIVITCLSCESISKKGFVQREIRMALDVADEQPEGSIFIIPLKLEECDIPKRLSRWHWVNYFEDEGYDSLLRSLIYRANEIGGIILKDSTV